MRACALRNIEFWFEADTYPHEADTYSDSVDMSMAHGGWIFGQILVRRMDMDGRQKALRLMDG